MPAVLQTLPAGALRPARMVVAAGLLFLILVLAAASANLGAGLIDATLTGARRMGIVGWLGLVTSLAGVSGVIGLGWLAARSRLTDRQLLLVGVVMIAAVRLVAVIAIDAAPRPDGIAYRELAQWLASGGCCFADRPTGYPALLALGYRLFGESAAVHEAINVGAAMVGGWIVWALVRPASGRLAAALALFAFAAIPTQVLLTPVLMTDVVYTTFILAVCWAAVRMASGSLVAAVAAGVLLAGSQYIRPIAPALLPALAIVPLLWVRPARRSMLSLAVLGGSFLVTLAPVLVHNEIEHQDLSLSTSSYGGWSLFIGTDQQHNGRVNAEDITIIQALPGASLWDRSELAGSLAMRRVVDDPIGFAGLAVRKFPIMWGREDYGVDFAFNPTGQPRGVLAGLDLSAQLTYVPLVLLALASALALLRSGRAPPPLAVVVIGIVICEAVVHTFLEVKPRYHAHTVPLFLLFASFGMTSVVPNGWRRVTALARRVTRPWQTEALDTARMDHAAHSKELRPRRRRAARTSVPRAAMILLLLVVPILSIEAGVRGLIAAGRIPIARAHSHDFEVSWMNLQRAGAVDVLILGDSVAQQGIDPQVISDRVGTWTGHPVRAFNMASASGTFGVNVAVARQLAAEGRLPPVVVIGVQPGILRDDATLAIFERSQMGELFTGCAGITAADQVLSCRLSQLSAGWRWRGQLDTLWRALLHEPRHTSRSEGLTLRTDGFREGAGVDDKTLAAQLPEHLANRDPAFQLGNDARQSYLSLVAFLRDEGTAVVPVAIPEAPPLARALEARDPGWTADWHAALAALSSAGGIPIADPGTFGTWYGKGSMRNIKHLSVDGARHFTNQLLDMPQVREGLLHGLLPAAHRWASRSRAVLASGRLL